jgi:small subunit ribosomal protein S14
MVFSKDEQKRILFKSIIYNKSLKSVIRKAACLKLSNLPKNGSKTRLTNRCVLTGRAHAVQNHFKLSRISLLNSARFGKISGIKKAVW